MRPRTGSGTPSYLKAYQIAPLNDFQALSPNYSGLNYLNKHIIPYDKKSGLELRPATTSAVTRNSFLSSGSPVKAVSLNKDDVSYTDEFKKIFTDISTLQKLDATYPTYTDINILQTKSLGTQISTNKHNAGPLKEKRASVGRTNYEISFNFDPKFQDTFNFKTPNASLCASIKPNAKLKMSNPYQKVHGAHSPALTPGKLQEILTQEAKRNEICLKPSGDNISPVSTMTRNTLIIKRKKMPQTKNRCDSQTNTDNNIPYSPHRYSPFTIDVSIDIFTKVTIPGNSGFITKPNQKLSFKEAYGNLGQKKEQFESLDFLSFSSPKKDGYRPYSKYKHRRSQSLNFKL